MTHFGLVKNFTTETLVNIRAAWVLKEDASSYFTINTDANWDLKVRAWL